MRLVKTRLRYQKIFALGFALGNIFLVASMVLAILHNVIIGQTVRLGACTSRGKRLYYNATLCNLASDIFNTGISGTVVVVGV